jgi:molybdate transport system ATP-binding protein
MTMQISLDIGKTLRSGDRDFQLRALRIGSQRVVVYGPSGAGKSQMMKALAGLMTPDSGRIELAGRCLFDSHGRHQRAGAAAQRGLSVPGLRAVPAPERAAEHRLRPAARLAQSARAWTARRSATGCRRLNWDMWRTSFRISCPAASGSGGAGARAGAAAAALLLDEPFAALDPGLRERMRAELDACSAGWPSRC